MKRDLGYELFFIFWVLYLLFDEWPARVRAHQHIAAPVFLAAASFFLWWILLSSFPIK